MLSWMTIAKKWYTSGDIKEAKKFLDNSFPQLQEEVDCDIMGLQ